METLFESMHVVIFGVLALTLFIATGLRREWGLVQRVAAVCAAIIVLSLLSEGAQIPGPRDASFEDLVADWLGASVSLFFALSFSSRPRIRPAARIALALAGLTTGLVGLWPIITVSAAYLERNLQRPVIVSFDSRFGQTFWRTQHATLQLSPEQATGKTAATITLGQGTWPALIFTNIWPDWREYSTLVVDLGLDGTTALKVNIRVHDRAHKFSEQLFSDRFNLAYELRPGRHTLRIPLGQIRDGPKGRQMDLSQIEGIVIFCSSGHAGRQFELLELRLEKISR